MTATKIDTKLTSEPLRKETILDLLHVAGPCVTLLLPPYRSGEFPNAPQDFLPSMLPTISREASEPINGTYLAGMR